MRKMLQGIFLGLVALDSFSACAANWNGRIIQVAEDRELGIVEMVQALNGSRNIVLGEKHHTAAVQSAQASVMDAFVRENGKQGRFVTAWEFLNASEQSRVEESFEKFKNGKIDVSELLRSIVGNEKSMSYAPILEVTRAEGGFLLGVNLSREEKAPVVRDGIGAADPARIPPGFEMGSSRYFERFSKAMEGHATPEQMENYFAAQCLTDDVMAYQLLGFSRASTRFLVVGGFHVDYFDGVVARLRARAPDQVTKVVRFIDASDYHEWELKDLLRDPHWGAIADYAYFVNEPIRKAPQSARMMFP